MASIKQLAGQTVWYGFSNIAARLLTYLLTPFLTNVMLGARGQEEWGRYGLIYAYLPVLNVLCTYGMETSYFRFSSTEDKNALFRTQMTAMLLSTLFFGVLLWVFRVPVAGLFTVEKHIEYIGWIAGIVGLDALSALPFARLRKENRPRKYAFVKVAGILVFVGTVVLLFSAGDDIARSNPGGLFARFYKQYWGLGFILFANLLQAIVSLLLLVRELSGFRLSINRAILKKVLVYGLPILVAGFAGMINDSLNRVMFERLFHGTQREKLIQLGYFTAALRLSVMINLAIQAFKMAAEPFFFSISGDKNAPGTYARIMKWFVIVLALMFLGVTLYMDVWKYFVGREYRSAFGTVPVLLLSYIFLGVYYNLTVWYKLTDKTYFGTYIMIIGAVFTVIFNWLLIPLIGYYACAWGMLLSYALMMLLSYYWGQKYYPIPYATKKLMSYLGVALVLFAVQWGLNLLLPHALLRLLSGTLLMGIFLYLVFVVERKELKSFPVIGKFIR